jgi:dTDP-4-amino-4,6-dideoxygalactose transaminase
VIRLTVPSIGQEDLAAVREVLESGYLVQGKNVAAFERAVAQHVGVPEAVAVSNCTAALHLALLALNVGPGDIVLVAAYSWIATANVIELCGARPEFIDITPDTFNLDPARLEAALGRLMGNAATARRVKAILPVHTFGQMADLPSILALANRWQIPVVEDAACALGASWHERQAGTWGLIGCFSFHPRKAVTTGEGGMLTTSDKALAARLRAIRNHGIDPDAAAVDFILPGLNCRLTDFQGALGVTQMAKLGRIIAARRARAEIYHRLLAGTGVQPPFVPPRSQHVFQSYVVLLPARQAARRPALITALKQSGIETTIGTWHMPLTTYFRSKYHFAPGDFPVADQVFARALTLPLHEGLTEAEQRTVVTRLCALLSSANG